MEQHRHYLAETLKLAELRRGFCAPNPAVGALVVKNKLVIATGHHLAAGQPHAEVVALQQAEDSTAAVLYVSLEPCCHQGKTPPCTELIIASGIRAVYYAFKDPNPLVAGQGESRLRAAGIICEQVPLPTINAFYQSYAYWQAKQKPWVTAKLALSLDGKIAGAEGQPITLTGASLQAYTHHCRKSADAILTTVKTLLRDDPQLNVRLDNEAVYRKPLYVLDTYLNFSANLQVLNTAKSITLFHQAEVDPASKTQLAQYGICCVPVAIKNAKLDLNQVLAYIGQAGIHDLWVEAGGTCFQSLAETDNMQQGLIYVAAKYLGEQALSAFHGNYNFLASANSIEWQTFGVDALCKLCWTSPIAD